MQELFAISRFPRLAPAHSYSCEITLNSVCQSFLHKEPICRSSVGGGGGGLSPPYERLISRRYVFGVRNAAMQRRAKDSEFVAWKEAEGEKKKEKKKKGEKIRTIKPLLYGS